jgi:hypothetical protein
MWGVTGVVMTDSAPNAGEAHQTRNSGPSLGSQPFGRMD